MSTTLPMLASLPTTTPTGLTGPTAVATPGQSLEQPLDTVAADFSAVFSELLSTANGSEPSVLPAALPLPTGINLPSEPALVLSPDGNSLPPALPQLAWSGTIALADEHGASALQMAGDAERAVMTPVMQARDLNTAVHLASRQLPPGLSLATLTPAQTLHSIPLQPELIVPVDAKFAGTAPLDPLLNAMSAADGFSSLSSTTVGSFAAGQALASAVPSRIEGLQGQLSLPVSHPNWANQLSESIRWVVQQHGQQAELRLNPPELGILEVRIQLNQDQTQITFSSPHAHVRDAIESAIPRLRDMFAGIGLNLGDVDVSHQSFAQRQDAPSGREGSSASAGGPHAAEGQDGALPALSARWQGQGLVDVYA